MSEHPLKPYVVRLSLPVEAVSMPAAIETFLGLAKEHSWVFQVDTPEGRYWVDTVVENGAIKEFAVIRCDPKEPVELMGT